MHLNLHGFLEACIWVEEGIVLLQPATTAYLSQAQDWLISPAGSGDAIEHVLSECPELSIIY